MPHNITGSNTFTDPVPTYSDGDPVAQGSEDPTIQALANRDVNVNTRLTTVEGYNANSRLNSLESKIGGAAVAWGLAQFRVSDNTVHLLSSFGFGAPSIPAGAPYNQGYFVIPFSSALADANYTVHTQGMYTQGIPHAPPGFTDSYTVVPDKVIVPCTNTQVNLLLWIPSGTIVWAGANITTHDLLFSVTVHR